MQPTPIDTPIMMFSGQHPPPPIYGLSQEIIDEIIDILYQLCLAHEQKWSYEWKHVDLAHCALVCRSFSRRSRMHLFSRITLPAKIGSRELRVGDYSRISSLLDILEKRPTLVEHIRELRLILPGGHASWMYNTPEMLTLMDKINSTNSDSNSKAPVRKLKLELCTSPGQTSFKVPSPTSRLKLMDLFERAFAPCVTALRIEYISDVPPELLALCTHLRDLTLLWATLRKAPPWPSSEGSPDPNSHQPSPSRPHPTLPPPKIEHFEYNVVDDGAEGSYISSLAQIFIDESLLDFTRLRSLTTYVGFPGADLYWTQKIIDATEGTLERLVIKVQNDRDESLSFPSMFLNLEKQPNLNTVTYIAFFPAPGMSNLSETCQTLKTIATSKLRNFHFIFYVHPPADVLGDADWDTFVGELLRISESSDMLGGKLELSLTMYFQIPADYYSGNEPLPWKELGTGPEGYAEKVLERLVEERLSSLKNCGKINLDTHVTVKDHREYGSSYDYID